MNSITLQSVHKSKKGIAQLVNGCYKISDFIDFIDSKINETRKGGGDGGYFGIVKELVESMM